MPDAATYEKVFRLFVEKDAEANHLTGTFESRYIIKHNCFYFATDHYSMIFLPVEKAEILTAETIPVKWHQVIPTEKNCNIQINIAEFERQLVPDMIDEIIEDEFEIECPECSGDGEIICELGHEHDCAKCNGDGVIVTKTKKATGNKIAFHGKSFRLNDVVFLYKQLRRLADACKLLEVETITQTFIIKNKGNLFECGDASILVMPVVRDPDPDNITVIQI